jgi:ankyrin repeat protein
LKHGANVSAKDDYALRWSALNGHLEVVKLLLEHGADISIDIIKKSHDNVKEYLQFEFDKQQI